MKYTARKLGSLQTIDNLATGQVENASFWKIPPLKCLLLKAPP